MFSRDVHELVRKSIDAFPSDIDKAIDLLEIELKNTGLLQSNSAAILRLGLRTMIHERRSQDNSELLGSTTSAYTGPPKVRRGAAADLVTERYLETWKIDGRVLGEILGDELPLLATRMRQAGEGFFIRERLCLLLIPKVPKNKRVSDCVTNDQVGSIIQQSKTVLETVHETIASHEDRQLSRHGRKPSANGRHGKAKLAATA